MKRFTCHWPFEMLVVLCDGKVVCGCADPYGERPVGHLDNQSILEIWNSKQMQNIRADLNHGGSNFCRLCGLKKYLEKEEKIPQQDLIQERLPRLFIEPTVVCNLSCFKSVCSKESGILNTRSRKYMPLDQFKTLVDSAGVNLIRIDLFNYGDPFMHPNIIEMMTYIKTNFPHIYLYTSTNGLPIKTEDIPKIVHSGLDEITFSIDGCSQKSYEKYRRGGHFNRVMEIMHMLIQERNASSVDTPFINWRYILFKWNDHFLQMKKARRLAKKLGVDRLTWEITDHPSEAKSKKYQINSSAWKKIYNEIWDTSQISNAIPGKKYIARIDVKTKEIQGIVDQSTAVTVDIENQGGAIWRKSSESGRRFFRLGAQLYDRCKNLIDFDYARAHIPRDISHHEKVTVKISLPELPAGEYRLKFDMVCEGVDWFETAGSQPVWCDFNVTRDN